MEKIFNAIDEEIIVINKKGIILFCNDALLKKIRYEKNEIENMHINSILSERDDLSKEIINNIDKNIENKIPLIFNAKNGDEISVIGNLNLEKWKSEDALFIILKSNISEAYSKKDLEILLDEIPYSVWAKDMDGKYVYLNKVHSTIMGQKKCDVIGRNDYGFWPEGECEYYDQIDNEVIKKRSPILYQKEFNRIPSNKWYETYKAPIIGEDNKVKYIIAIGKDITLNKKVEAELDRSHSCMCTLNNIVSNSTYEDSNNIFNNIEDDIMSKIAADGIGIWIHDDKKNELIPKFSLGISKELNLKDVKINISRAEFEDGFKDWPYEGITPIDERKDIDLKSLKDANVKYIGTYLIRFSDRIIGTMNILYKNDNHSRLKKDEFIKTLCNQISILIINDFLNRDIKTELNKRMKTERELELLLNTAAELMALVDENGKFIKVNIGWTKNLGWSEEEILSMNWNDIIVKDDIEVTLEFVERLKKHGEVGRLVNRYICKNGEVRWLEWNSRYIKERKISVCTARDITKQKEAEEQKDNYKKAIELEKIKSEFFSNISHEFKTPLNIILATMQLANHNIDNKKIISLDGVDIKRYMTSIKQNSYRLLRLVNNLIDMSRIDTGFYGIHLENQNIVSIVEDITISVAEYIEDKGIKLIFDTEVEDLVIACDPDKIERIMLNFLSNAIKYTSEEGCIEVYLQVKGDKVRVSVKDDGIGIEAEKLELIFSRFMQVDNVLTRGCEGSGIGLSLVKSLVEMHEGTVWAMSENRNGTTFTFEIPTNLKADTKNNISSKDVVNSKVEKCNIEFADIYS